jgi:iron complex transport system substrate-binding protein
MKRIALPVFITVALLTCSSALWATGVAEPETDGPSGPGSTTVAELIAGSERIQGVAEYATGFEVYQSGTLRIVRVTRPWQGSTESDVLEYVLYPRDEPQPDVRDADLVVPVPVESVVTMSTTFLPHLIAVEALDSLVGIDMVGFAYAPEVHDLAENGEIIEVGSGPGVDVELMLSLNPDLTLVNSYGGDFDAQPALEAAGLPVVVLGDWVETTPLGRAEWLLFTSLFFDRLEEAQSIFAMTAREYRRLSGIARTARTWPSVIVNAPFQGTWSVPGGDSYMAQFINDAGGDYVYSDDTSTGALFYDIESVFAEAGEADIWINPGIWSTLAQGEAEDARFTEFKAFGDGAVYNNNRRIGPGGGSDYFESGAVSPHVVLADLLWVFHPELVPDYAPYYYQQLK